MQSSPSAGHSPDVKYPQHSWQRSMASCQNAGRGLSLVNFYLQAQDRNLSFQCALQNGSSIKLKHFPAPCGYGTGHRLAQLHTLDLCLILWMSSFPYACNGAVICQAPKPSLAVHKLVNCPANLLQSWFNGIAGWVEACTYTGTTLPGRARVPRHLLLSCCEQ